MPHTCQNLKSNPEPEDSSSSVTTQMCPSQTALNQGPLNGAIHIVSSILKNVMASATEAKVGALFHNAQDACMIRNALDFPGCKQPATPIQTNDSSAEGIINNTVKQTKSKAIDL